jgi:hypothetical protein
MNPADLTSEPIEVPLPLDLQDLLVPGETPLKTLASTMQRIGEHLERDGAIDTGRSIKIFEELDRLAGDCVESVAVRDILVAGELSPRSYMALMVNTVVRVLPTYAEIPLNLAVHGVQGDLRNYGLIALNVNDEAGEGDPLRTHPALFNLSARALSPIFGVPPLSIKVGLAALQLKLHEGSWSSPEEGLGIVRDVLLRDEFGRRSTADRLLLDFGIACEYSDLIARETVECYLWRMQTFADILTAQLRGTNPHQGYVELASLLAVREAAASDPGNIFHSLSEMVTRYGGHLGTDTKVIADALRWSDVHIDEELGEEAGYEGHSVEDDHAEQALGAVLDHLHDDCDLLLSIQAMNAVNAHLRSLWEGTRRVMEEQEDEKIAIKRIPPELHAQMRKERQQGVLD